MEVLILNLYFELLKTPVFTVEDVNNLINKFGIQENSKKPLKTITNEIYGGESILLQKPIS